MEVDNEVSGNGNSYTTEFRQYDPRLGRWKSLDPIIHPNQSPFCAFDNNPVLYNDPNGLKAKKWSENRANRKANRMKRKGYENVRVAASVDGDGNSTGNYGVYTSGKSNGSGAGHYFAKTKNKKIGNHEFAWSSSKNGYYWGDQNIKDLSNIQKEFIRSGAYDRMTAPLTFTFGGEEYTFKTDHNSGVSARIDRMALTWWKMQYKQWSKQATDPLREVMKIRIALGGEGPGLIRPGVFAGGVKIYKGVNKVMGKSYEAAGEVVVEMKNIPLLKKLTAKDPGKWVKVYEAGVQNGKKIEVHYHRNQNTGKVFDVKVKYQKWHQKAFKKL